MKAKNMIIAALVTAGLTFGVTAQAKEKEQLVEAHAYIGMALSLDRQREEGLPHLKWVTSNGTRDSAEYFGAE